MSKLSPTQITILKNAVTRPDGNIEPLPDNINAGIKPRVINGLLTRELIEFKDDKHCINAAGLAAIGHEPSTPTKDDKPSTPSAKQPRAGSKLAAIVALLERDGGATLDELCEATGWLKHTLRGTFAGTLKKRFNYTITSTKKDGEPRRYCITHNEEENSEECPSDKE
jgi:hypothetical protein